MKTLSSMRRYQWFVDCLLIFAILLIISACRRALTDVENAVADIETAQFENVMVHSSNLPLFCDMSSYNLLPVTKADRMVDDTLLSLDSMLDRSGEENDEFDGWRITAIPFKDGCSTGAVSITSKVHSNLPIDSLSCTRIFLVRTYDTEVDTAGYMVVTMIPDVECLDKCPINELSYIDKSLFSGLLLYSALDGTFLESLYVRRNTPLAESLPLYPSEAADTSGYDGCIYLSSGAVCAETKAIKKVTVDVMLRMAYAYLKYGADGEQEVYNAHGGESAVDGGTLAEAYCYGNKNRKGKSNSEDSDITEQNNSIPSIRGGAYSNSGGRKKILENYTYAYTLITNGNGTVSGGGVYLKGQKVNIYAQPNSASYFFKWSGDLSGNGSFVSIVARSNISSTAVFLEWKNALPCYDSKTGIMNPLNDMRIAPTNSGNLTNGTFFNNGSATSNMDSYPNSYAKRDKDKHQGIDLAAEVGTPIYAPCDGIISGDIYVTDIPDRDPKNKQYTDSTYIKRKGDDAGNRIGLECVVNGKKIRYTYWHLEAGNAVAINPRTGQCFTKGQKVYQGEIIGYVGRTGNAYNVTNTHLHLGVWDLSEKKWVNPEEYLNGKVDKTVDGKVKSNEMININCNSAIK